MHQHMEANPYPKSTYLIIIYELCERFSFNGLITILSLYLRDILLFSESDSTIIFHAFIMLNYLFPLFGATLSDSYIGKFKTIFYSSVVYTCGTVLLTLSSDKVLGLPQISFSMLGLFLTSLGGGAAKACVAPIGGDQFILPQEELGLETFFSMFYFAVNVGSLIAIFLTPILRKDVHCFGIDSCYPLAFGILAVLLFIALVVFAAGKSLYKIQKPKENIVAHSAKCVGYGVMQKFKSKDKVDHWLDRSKNKYGHTLVNDVKITLKVLVLFIPLPVFWALFDQQGSGWTFQATRMDGHTGFFTILPDQMQLANPLLILVFIPLFSYLIYPALTKMNLLKTPLQRMVFGQILSVASFIISAGLSFALEATYPVLPGEGICQLRVYNPLRCNSILNALPYVSNLEIKSMGYAKLDVKISGETTVDYTITGCNDMINVTSGSDFTVNEKKSLFYYMSSIKLRGFADDIDKDIDGLPKIRTLVNKPKQGLNLTYWYHKTAVLRVPSDDHDQYTIDPGTYKLDKSNKELNFYLGGVYTVLVSLNELGAIQNLEYFEITEPNSVHMLWQLPQYILLTAGEIMFSITGLEISYSQAPVSMKSVLSAAYLLTSAIGNLIVVITESAKLFGKQSFNFLLYAGLMVLDTLLFAFIATKYTYVDLSENEESEQLGENS